MHNTKHEVKWNVKVEILEKFMTELRASGYSEKDRYEILRSGIKSYESLRKQEEEGKRPFFRNRNFNRKQRITEKEAKKGNWFKQKDNKFSSVFFVPPTPGSQLLKMLKKTEDKFKIDEKSRIKFVETSGRKYIDYYRNSNPFNVRCKPEDRILFAIAKVRTTLIAKLQILVILSHVNFAKREEDESRMKANLRAPRTYAAKSI